MTTDDAGEALVLTPPPQSQAVLADDAERWAAKARGLRITDAESCINASHLLKSIKGLRLEIAHWFAPHIEAAMETKRKAEAARKALCDEMDRMEAPLVQAEAITKRALLAWEAAEETRRLEEERRLQAEAQARAEQMTLEAAAAMELEAEKTGDAGLLEEAQSILAQPVEAPVVVVQPTVPKVAGITYRDKWVAKPEIDVRQLAAAVAAGTVPVTFLTPNMTAINAFARATEGTQPVPGVVFYNAREIAARR